MSPIDAATEISRQGKKLKEVVNVALYGRGTADQVIT
jgi:hypothetical protein